MDFNQLADGVVKEYVNNGYPAAMATLDNICERRNIYGWTKLFLIAKVKTRLLHQNPTAYRNFIADSKGIDKKKSKR